MTKDLKNRIKKAAQYDGRSMANFAAQCLKQAIEDLEREQRLTASNTPPDKTFQ
jgi:pyruvate/2-oxoacid:ferredoxin oxidoreductase beta subunit